MIKRIQHNTFQKCLFELKNESVIAYPTEAVFALGCDPDSKKAVLKLLKIKKRPIEKGLILVAANYKQLTPYIKHNQLFIKNKKKIFFSRPNFSISWVVPASEKTPSWITGNFLNSLVIRISKHKIVKKICLAFGKPLVSTSANLLGENPCKTFQDVEKKFKNLPLLKGNIGNQKKPSEIRNIFNDEIIRYG